MTTPTTIRQVLMCPPTAYDVCYEINPWMHVENRPDRPLAAKQWDAHYQVLATQIGLTVHLIPQPPECPDMVFTANAGLVYEGKALLSQFRHPQRQPEVPYFRTWFEQHGYQVITPPPNCHFEGEGDALFVGDVLVAGYLKRSDICSHRWLTDTLGLPVLSLELVDDRWYHLDTCFLPLEAHLVAYYPAAFDNYARTVIENNFETIPVREEEALRFACNAVVIGHQVVLPTGCPQLTDALQQRGFVCYAVEMSEFLKAGGAAKCLTLLLR
jgi:N-dimethylarginine dimethylaminohydrolase